ncbi:MAG: hypothetical protein DDT31_01566 [Syntrophomonadaceae bacterium]|nr:hypothetical protein [Bacillota bacterium]
MILNEQQRKEFEAAARPLIKWLNKNCHPHVTVIVEPGGAELTEAICSVLVGDYIPD